MKMRKEDTSEHLAQSFSLALETFGYHFPTLIKKTDKVGGRHRIPRPQSRPYAESTSPLPARLRMIRSSAWLVGIIAGVKTFLTTITSFNTRVVFQNQMSTHPFELSFYLSYFYSPEPIHIIIGVKMVNQVCNTVWSGNFSMPRLAESKGSFSMPSN